MDPQTFSQDEGTYRDNCAEISKTTEYRVCLLVPGHLKSYIDLLLGHELMVTR